MPDDFRTLVTELAASVPEVEAILAPRRTSMRFAELPARLDEIRDALRDRGIGRGDRVVVVLPHGPEMAVCYLGVVACATFVPLNPDYTEAEFARYLGRLNAKALVVQQGRG